MIQIGDLQCEVLSGGRFKLDGGGMFGIIPRMLWSRQFEPDDRGRIQLDTNCILVRTGDELVLIDTGNGPKMTTKEQTIFGLAPSEGILHSLATHGVAPAEINTVLLTHLHMDHVGGASHVEDDEPVISFPNARYVAQRREWEDAIHNYSHMRASYRLENLLPIQRSGRLELLDGDAEVAPGISVHVTGGHTPAHQCVFLRSRGETGVFLADVCPTPAHFRPPYNMAYDLEPYVTMRVKGELLSRAAQEGWLCFFDHEPARKVVRVREEDGQFAADPVAF